MTIHVLQVIDLLAPGGAERQLVNLVRTHDSSRVRSSVVTLFEGSDLATELEGAGVHVERLGLSSPRQLLRGVHRLRRYIADAQLDPVHTRPEREVRTRFDVRVAARRFEQLYEEVAWEGADPRVS